MMNSIVYIKALLVLLGIVSSIFLVIWGFKKIKLHERFTIKTTNRIAIIETKRIDHNKTVSLITIDGVEYGCVLSENYGLLLFGGESRIRTYERARRADLQSAAFGHSATSP
jgi:hypothetical protein